MQTLVKSLLIVNLLIGLMHGPVYGSDRPSRIVTLTPAVAELCADFLEADLDRIVGVSSYTDYPPALSSKPVIANHAEIFYERLLALKPDLVIASRDGQPRRVIDRLRSMTALPFRVEEIDTSTLQGVAESFEKVGSWLGEPQKGHKFAEEFKDEIERLKKTSAQKQNQRRPISVAVIVGYKPWVVAGNPSFIHGLLETLSARNAFADSKTSYPRISEEELIRRNPDVVIFLSRNGTPEGGVAEIIKKWKALPGFKAAQENRVVVLEADPMVRPSRRLRVGLRNLAEALR